MTGPLHIVTVYGELSYTTLLMALQPAEVLLLRRLAALSGEASGCGELVEVETLTEWAENHDTPPWPDHDLTEAETAILHTTVGRRRRSEQPRQPLSVVASRGYNQTDLPAPTKDRP